MGDQAITISERVNSIRKMPTQEAQKELWSWFQELGKNGDWDSLIEIFKLGTPPSEIKGKVDGITLGRMHNLPPLVERFTNLIADVFPIWLGKYFNDDGKTGCNRLTRMSRFFLPKLTIIDEVDNEVRGVRFKTSIVKSAIEPIMDIRLLDFSPPEFHNATGGLFPIARWRDEVVEIIPNIYLARTLLKDKHSNNYVRMLFFAMRPTPLKK